ncbi:MAG TPA: sigma-70 family RNA polymerase sigma factor [Candidatus Hydrogenedentes bacterium]|nr:sigma-70 family RNA polymerase sigma factor [Candidatus Hydrogenedentota bacterium]HOS01605.1 sigma-70 family RNA polymerase sigma factor [Candidatus Hydrogenedentota bacterium]
MDLNAKTDEELMVLLDQGQRQALAELVHRYQADIFRFCLHYLRDVEQAKDMAQEAFIRVYKARDRFDEKRVFRPWVLCIARNLCLNAIKHKRAVPMESIETYASSARADSGELFRSSADGAEEQLIAADRRAFVTQALEGLDDESREIVMLRFFEHMQARDIADIVGSTEGAVRTRLHRILRMLRERYGSVRDAL